MLCGNIVLGNATSGRPRLDNQIFLRELSELHGTVHPTREEVVRGTHGYLSHARRGTDVLEERVLAVFSGEREEKLVDVQTPHLE